MFSELILTDGITEIDLLNGNKNGAGFSLIRYVPGRPNFKGGGIWQDSPLAAGRQLVAGVRTNTTDALTLRIAYPSHDEIITASNDFDELIEKAIAYWTTTWQQTPVYLQAQVHGESSKRYALVHYAQYDSYFDPYAQPYISAGMHTTDEFIFGIERGLWLEFVPGEYESVAISHANSGTAQSYDCTVNPLNGLCEDTFLNVLIGNMHNRALQAIYRFTGSFSANLLGTSPPYAFTATPPATGDILYLGADQPFYGIATYLSDWADGATFVQEYWNGAAWTTLTPDTRGPGSFTWSPDVNGIFAWPTSSVSNWAKTTVNSESRYWIRFRVSSGGGTTTYVQANRHIYSTATNYIEVAEDEVLGTMDALQRALIQFYPQSTTDEIKVWMGLRTYERGANFVAHLNVGTTSPGNPTGVTVTGTLATVEGHANATVNSAAVPTAPGGESVALTGVTNDVLGTIFYLTFNSSVCEHFYGRFRLFVLLNSDDNTGASRLRYSVTNYTNTATYVRGEIKAVATSPTTYQLVDLGNVTLPAADTILTTDATYGFQLRIDGLVTNAKTLTFLSVILMPADEMLMQMSGSIPEVTTENIEVVLLDSIEYPKYPTRAFAMDSVINDPYLAISGPVTVNGSGEAILHAGTRQRFWFLFQDANASPAIPANLKLYKCQRYIGLRGD